MRDDTAAPGSLEALRERNRTLVLAALRRGGGVSRAELARRTGLSRSTISTVVADLVAAGIATEAGAGAPEGVGRPGVPVTLNAAAGAAVGIAVGPASARVVLADLGHAVLAEDEVALPEPWTVAELVEAVAAAVHGELARAGVVAGRLIGAGVAIPAPVDRDDAQIGESSTIPALAGSDLGPALAERLGVPVRVENDANACAVAEVAWGAGAGASDVVYLKLSRGIGAGLVLDDRLYGGAAGTAGEIGHTTRSGDGELCRCGNRGCLETTAGSEAIARRAGRVDVAAVVAGAETGDVACRRALRDAGTEIGLAAATICNILNPRRIVIGGELAAAWPFLAASFTAAVDRAAIHAAATSAEVRVGTLGARAEALGALALVLRDGDRFTVEMIGRTA
jgi:predicted NBD/HSP70 family sugar kinase